MVRMRSAGMPSETSACLVRVGAVVAQRQVVLGRAALVAVSFDGELHVGMLLQEARVRLQDLLILSGDIVAVVVEEHVLHVLLRTTAPRSRCFRCGVVAARAAGSPSRGPWLPAYRRRSWRPGDRWSTRWASPGVEPLGSTLPMLSMRDIGGVVGVPDQAWWPARH